jgi:hypothetical protein
MGDKVNAAIKWCRALVDRAGAAIGRWRARGRQRRIDARESRIRGRENLRDYKPFRGVSATLESEAVAPGENEATGLWF